MKKVIKNILNEELERTREMMGLLVEQPSQIQFPIWETCQNGVVVAPFSSNNVFGQAVINPGNWNGVYDPMMWSQESQAFYSLMGSPNIGDVVQFDTTTDTTAACNADDAELNATANLTPIFSENFFSNSLIFFPPKKCSLGDAMKVEILPLSRTSIT